MLELIFPFAPLSQNNIERTGRKNNHRYKTDEAKAYRANIEAICLKNRIKVNEFLRSLNPKSHILSISYDWCLNYEDLLTKGTKKEPRRLKLTAPDTFNFEKYTTDCIFDAMGINDVLIWNGAVKRVPVAGKSYFVCRLVSENILLNRHHSAFLTDKNT